MDEIQNKKFKIVRIIWYSQQTNWGVLATEPLEPLDGYEIDLMNDFSNVCIQGNFEGAFEGAEIIVSGDIVENPKYGKQIQIKYIKIAEDTKSREGIVNFLARSLIKGISIANANKIYDEFKEDSINIVLNKPDKLDKIRGIGEKTVQKVKESVANYRSIEPLVKYCTSIGLSYSTIKMLNEELGTKALATIKEDPYKVLELTNSIPFSVIDEIFINAGGSPKSSRRLKVGLLWLLRRLVTLEGSTGCKSISLMSKFLPLLKFNAEDEPLFWETLTSLKKSGEVVLEKEGSVEIVYYKEYLDIEDSIAHTLHILEHEGITTKQINKNIITQEIHDFPFTLNTQQVNAVNECLKHNVSVITGVPGSGKSSITKAIYNIYERSRYNVELLAPTAKAARRLEECTGGVAQTIHKFLNIRTDWDLRESEYISKYSDNTVLIVDEASMVDILLFNKLLKSAKSDTRILLVGDNNQLPSVQAGNVLGDVIASNDVYVATLTDVVRQKENSNIIKFCNMINKGEIFDPCEFADFRYEEFGTAAELKEVLFETYMDEVKTYGLNEVQVIAPYKQGEIGMSNLNLMLQAKYQDYIKGPMAIEPFRLGDKVRHTKNNYKRDVYNGETGVIIGLDEDELIVDFGNKHRRYAGSDLSELTLSFASTVHASQGSEYKVVFVILDDTAVNNFLHIRRLLYTAVSRGKQKVYILTKPYLVDKCIENNSYRPRITKLKKFLEELKKCI